MVTYTYIVKCPECEDEFFDFFEEAKEFALGCMSKKPIITQTEVNRNDFGECIDHCDLGTVWSWEDMMKETNSKADDSCSHVLCKADLEDIDSEFDDIDNSVDFEPEISSNNINESTPGAAFANNIDTDILSELTKGVPEEPITARFEKCSKSAPRNALYYVNQGEDVTFNLGNIKFPTKQIAHCWITHNGEVLQTRNSQYPNDLITKFSIDLIPGDTNKAISDIKGLVNNINGVKESYTKKPVPEGMTIEQLVEEMEENEDTVECTWCNDLFDKSECRKEIDLGWLCSRCEMAIKSRGETLTFKENNYWDFLDEEVKEVHDLGNTYDGGYPETEEVTDSHLALCPECGKDSFDTETGICVECGFN